MQIKLKSYTTTMSIEYLNNGLTVSLRTLFFAQIVSIVPTDKTILLIRKKQPNEKTK